MAIVVKEELHAIMSQIGYASMVHVMLELLFSEKKRPEGMFSHFKLPEEAIHKKLWIQFMS